MKISKLSSKLIGTELPSGDSGLAASFEYISINTGLTRKSWRNEIDDDAVAEMQDWLFSSMPIYMPGLPSGSSINHIPGHPGFAATFTAHGQALIVNVLFDLVPCVTFGIASTSSDTDCEWLWQRLHNDQIFIIPAVIKPSEQPQSPWCAVMVEPEFLHLCRKDHMWLDGFERYVAWAWLDLCQGEEHYAAFNVNAKNDEKAIR